MDSGPEPNIRMGPEQGVAPCTTEGRAVGGTVGIGMEVGRTIPQWGQGCYFRIFFWNFKRRIVHFVGLF